jgi:hypothetical protein
VEDKFYFRLNENSGTPVQDVVHDVTTLLPALIDKS